MDTNQNGFQNQPPFGNENPYGNQNTTRMPVVNRANSMASAAMSLGIVALILSFTCTLYPTLVFGGVAVILALLSKGADAHMHANARTGIITATVGLVFNLIIVITSFVLIFSPVADPKYKEEFNKMYEQFYGQSFDDTMNEISSGK